MTDVTSSAIRCYELDSTSATNAGIATVAAGSTVGFKADNTMGHPGVRIVDFTMLSYKLTRKLVVFLRLYDGSKPSRQLQQCWAWQDLVQDLGMGTDVFREHWPRVCLREYVLNVVFLV